MTPVDQEFLHSPEPGAPKGDCFRACLATILDLPIAEVPHVVDGDDGAFLWVKRTQEFLVPRGFFYLETPHIDWSWLQRPYKPIVIGCGKSPRGPWGHAVVGELTRDGFTLLHDPHPSHVGLAGPPETFGILMRFGQMT